MSDRMWSLTDFRYDEAIDSAEVYLYDGDRQGELLARGEAIALARAQGKHLITWWPSEAGETPSCVFRHLQVPLRWEHVPDPTPGPEFDERLWFEAPCGGRDFLAGNGHTFVGRLAAWCPHSQVGYRVSLGEMGAMPDPTQYFVKGFLTGSEPAPPENADQDPADLTAWRAATQRFRGTGVWYGRWETCQTCGCVLLPDSDADHCAEHRS